MTPTQIAILLSVIAAAIFFSGLAFVFSRVLFFKESLKKRLIAANVLFSETREVLLSLYREFKNAGVNFSNDDEEMTTKVRWLKTDVSDEGDVERIALLLAAYEKRLSFLAANHPWVRKGEEYESLKEALHDLNVNYRRIVAVYNSDVLGFNYWRTFLVYRPLFWVLGYKKANPLA